MAKNENKDSYKPLIFLIVLIILLWILSTFILFKVLSPMSERGAFGDMFGAINSLFSGGALAGVVYAIFLQKNELRLQRNELELTREELKRSAKAQEKSEQALRKQVQSLEKTAELNGLSSILEYQGSELVAARSGTSGVDTAQRDKARAKAEEVQQKIEQLIGEK